MKATRITPNMLEVLGEIADRGPLARFEFNGPGNRTADALATRGLVAATGPGLRDRLAATEAGRQALVRLRCDCDAYGIAHSGCPVHGGSA